MNKIAMYKEQIEKVALNAQKAREMAKGVGLLPEGQWKWALRKLRGAKGEALKGRELSEAKGKLGSLTNHEKNVVEATSRKAGQHKEIGYLRDGQRLKSKDMLVGDEGSVDFPFEMTEISTVHTHPTSQKILNKMYSKNPLKFVEDYYRKAGTPLDKKTMKLVEKEFKEKPALAKANVENLSRLISENHNVVTPGGALPSKINASISGDYSVYQANKKTNNIYSPDLHIEGIHKVKTKVKQDPYAMPEFKTRSIYFDRAPKKSKV